MASLNSFTLFLLPSQLLSRNVVMIFFFKRSASPTARACTIACSVPSGSTPMNSTSSSNNEATGAVLWSTSLETGEDAESPLGRSTTQTEELLVGATDSTELPLVT
ncbi:hypothetical protein Dimus_009845 [Dionaea muscipula]